MDVAEIGDVGEERGLLDLEMTCCACVGKRGNIRRSSAALEWDEAQQKVVAQRMQVGLSIRQLSLSAAQESSSCYNKLTGLVDTIVVPEELAELKDLTSILSLETWRTCLTEDERQDLCQYLPKAVDTEASVSTLLNGEHLFSKSPLPLWGAAVCDGSLHPDVLASRYLKNLHNGLTSSSGGMWGYYKKLEVTWKKRQGVENRSLVHAAREEIRTNASGPENGSQLQCVPEQSSRRQLIHAGSQEDYTKDKKYIENTRKTLNKLRQGRKKQKTNKCQEDVEQRNGPNSSAMSKWLENHSAMSFHHPVTGEELQDGVRIFKVSKRQLAAIMEKQDSGEDIHVYNLQSVLGNNNMGQASSNALQDHWQGQVLLELPLGHELFSKRKVQQAGRALLAAQLCVHQQAHVLLTPIHLSNGHVAADREEMVHREEKESLSTKLLDQRRLSCRQARSARDREQQWLKKPAPPPFAGVSRIEPEPFGPCEPSRSYNEDPPMQNRDILHPPPAQVIGGECHRASKSGRQSPPNEQVVQHNMRHESKDVSDEEESSIHQMWTSVSPDTQVLSSAEPLELAGKDTDIHEMKLFVDFRDPVKPVEGVAAAMGVVRGGLAREVESERETMIGAEEHTTASEMKLEGFSGNEVHPTSAHAHKDRPRLYDEHNLRVDPRSFGFGHLHETSLHHHGNVRRDGKDNDFQHQEANMPPDHRHSVSSRVVLHRGRGSENGALVSHYSNSDFTKQSFSNDVFLPSQGQPLQFPFEDPHLLHKGQQQRSSALGYVFNLAKDSFNFTAPSKQEVQHFIRGQSQHQEDVSPLHRVEHHRLQASNVIFSQSKSPPTLSSEPVSFFAGSQHDFSQLQADHGQGQNLWSSGSEDLTPTRWGPSEASPSQTIAISLERPPSPQAHWDQQLSWQQHGGSTPQMHEIQKTTTHHVHQGWNPIPVMAVSHNCPSPKKGFGGYSWCP